MSIIVLSKLKRIVYRAICVVGIATWMQSCSLLPETTWAYSAKVKVVDSAGAPIANAIVRSTDGQDHRTDGNGMTQVYYMNRGLHVITVSAEGLETTQSKTTMPTDSGKELTIVIKRSVTQ